MKEVETKIIDLGNSIGVIIPKSLREDSAYEDVGIEKGDPIIVEIHGSSLRIRKVNKTK